MAKLTILTEPNPILRKVAQEVETINDQLLKLIDDMVETMGSDVGLAAPQIGISQRILVMNLHDNDDFERPEGFYPIKMINPEIIERSKEMVTADEGCLSLPGIRISVERSKEVKVKYMDCNKQIQELEAKGWLARVVQHEMDHLNGKLAIDYLSSMKKDVALRKLKKLKKRIA
ncbi:MAG: peptide deformylase [Rickettsiaceae bacterium]|nr:peptide deformylase [Rickettsiaceae bacterium]